MTTAQRKQITYRHEQWRAVSAGILETAGTTFLLLIAVKHFQAGAIAKGLVASGGSLGLAITPAVVSIVAAIRWSSARAAAALAALAAIAFLVMAIVPLISVFVAGSILALTAVSAMVPLLTQLYHENYPAHERGKLFSATVMIKIAAAAAFSELAGQTFSGGMERFHLLLLIFSGASAWAAFCLWRCPSQPLLSREGTHPFRALRFAQDDRLFRHTLFCWMLMGFANLMMFPMRIEMLANPKYGLALSVAEIAFLVGVIPNTARILMSPFWGWIFDRANFFVLRIVLNLAFAAGILAFFLSTELWGLVAASIIYGIANAGGHIAWSLWVTKFAPENRVADYMSVHTFFTGLRGLIAPIIAFQLATFLPLTILAWASAALILLSCLLLLPEVKFGNRTRPAGALVEEISE